MRNELPFDLRPEDFRHAWPNAYTSAMIHTGKIHIAMNDQIKKVRSVVAECAEMNNATATNVRETSIFINRVMMKLLKEETGVLVEASRKFVRTIDMLSEDNVRKSRAVEARFNELAKERAEFEARKRELFDQPWYLRIWNAIRYKG